LNFRAVTSICIGLILLSAIIQGKRTDRRYRLFIIFCGLLFIIQATGFFYSENRDETQEKMILKSGLILVPVAAALITSLSYKWKTVLMDIYVLLLLWALVFCFSVGMVNFLTTTDNSNLFYHKLVSPLAHHAVYFSILVFLAIVYLFNRPGDRKLKIILISFFSVAVFFLSSKLVIVFTLIYLFIMLTRSKAVIFAVLLAALTITLIFLSKNPVYERFNEIADKNENLLSREKFDKGQYFDGIQFRALQWKWVPSIIQQEKAWLRGVSAGDAQAKLDSLYVAKNMYTGEEYSGDKGYLGYNTHSQFLESLLQSGLPGVIGLVLIWFSMIFFCTRSRSITTIFITTLFIAWSLIESVFETQYGIVMFCLFPAWVNLLELNNDRIRQE
jgi:O-antigen ligase